MKNKLLLIKTGNSYFRFSGDSEEVCSLDKASVYPMDRKETLLRKLVSLKAKGYSDVQLYVLTLHEEIYGDDS